MLNLRLFVCVFLSLTIVTGCAVNPVTGKRELAIVSEGQELAIGAEQYGPSQQSEGGVWQIDPELTRYVDYVGQRVARVSDRDLPYEFVVLNNSVPNAWALPGGKIAVNRGLLLQLNNEAELAAVLGHEVVHAAARHGANAMQRGMILQGVVLATALTAADSDYANYIVGGAQLGSQLITTKYGREAELESDYYGMQYMARAGYDPRAAIGLQQTFVKLSDGQASGWLDGLFASHPPSMERVAANQRTAQALNVTGELHKQQFDEHLAGLRNMQPAYDGLDEAVALIAKNDYINAGKTIDKALALLPAEARLHGVKGEVLLARNQYQAAAEAFTAALQRDNNYFEYYLGRGLAKRKLGDNSAARADLEQSNRLLPTAMASNELGQIALLSGDRTTAKNYFQTAMAAGGSLGDNASNAFIRLDLSDNPSQYVLATPALTAQGQLQATLANRTNLALRNISVEFAARVNNQTIQRLVTVDGLAAGAQGQVSSGWQFSTDDLIEQVQVRVLQAHGT
ncbi:MAG: M48 family metalloprotease [Pseudomonadales bacterium]|jgi:beta-barrel assembly-enhancing protease|nr:M48 family metalloprotease [Pseudomonadales bacterium]